MFTGVIQEVGTVVSVARANGLQRLDLHAPKTAARLSAGDSVAINGVCLSAMRLRQGIARFEVIPETQRLTTLGRLTSGARVNIEPSLTLSDRLNGHLVLGHVDGVGRIVRCDRQPGQVVLTIRMDRRLRHWLAPKSPVAIDGVSLTVGAELTLTTCSVFLIPETLRRTTLGLRKVGDLVNIEFDYVAKLLEQFVRDRLPLKTAHARLIRRLA